MHRGTEMNIPRSVVTARAHKIRRTKKGRAARSDPLFANLLLPPTTSLPSPLTEILDKFVIS